MPFPTNTQFDRYQPGIEWLLTALADGDRYPMLREHALPRLQRDLDDIQARWVHRSAARWEDGDDRANGYLVPCLVLSAHRWLEVGHEPFALLDRLERGLSFNASNPQEVGYLTGNFWDPQLSASIIMQQMVTASLQDRAPAGTLAPVTGDRPDLWVRLEHRQVGIEVTSRNLLEDLRLDLGRSIDWQRAARDFAHLWRRIEDKRGDYDGSYPIVLVLWDCRTTGDVYHFMSAANPAGARSFCDLLHMHAPDCSPLSAIIYLPYLDHPQITLCDGLSSGPRLTPNEVLGLRRLFDTNAAVENGFLPPQEMV